MNKQLFHDALYKITNNDYTRQGIGTLGERTLHAVLKHYFEPDENSHEIKLGGYVADIAGEDGVIEIQTRAFENLRRKLERFLEVTAVTVVYPVADTKWLIWRDMETGEITKKRKSPKRGSHYDIFFELYKIKHLLSNENLRLCIVVLDIEEYRDLNGWSHDKKRGSRRFERIPTDIKDEIYINNVSDYIKLIPDGLPEEFTTRDFKAAAKLSLRAAGLAVNVLNSVGTIKRIGKQGRSFVYQITNHKLQSTN